MTVATKTQPAISRVDNPDYWRVYHTEVDLARFDAIATHYVITSTGVEIHIDAYEQASSAAPVIIFNHGGGGYSRLFVRLALALYDKGYTVLVPDQRGQGLSGGDRSDFTMGQFVQNILDVAHWAKQHYDALLFLSGASLGGALTYKAAVAGAPVQAVVCHNLYDFGDPQVTLGVSIFAPLANIPFVPRIFSASTQLFATLMPTLRIPYQMLGKFKQMVDERNTDFFGKYQQDPYPIRKISLRYMASTFNTPPAIPLEQNTLPVLVINQIRDKMVNPEITRAHYERLGGKKSYVEIDYGHWAMGDRFEEEWAQIVDDFLSQFK